MKKVHRKRTEEENSSQCLKVLARDENGLAGIRHVLPNKINERILRKRQQIYVDKRLCYLQCFFFLFFFYNKDQRRKDGTDFETDMVVHGPESETLPPPPFGDFCRHVSFQSFTQGYLKNACLHLIGWWVWLCSNILFLSKESQVTHTKR